MIDRPTNGAVLDRQTLNRTLLARQLLLERAGAHPLEVVGHVVGMQAQTPLDPYVGVWSRVRTFEPETLAQALLDRQAVRMTLQRATLHLVTSDDALRLRPALQQMLERAFGSSPFARALAGVEVEPVLARGIELVEQQPRTVAQLGAALATDWPDADPEALAYGGAVSRPARAGDAAGHLGRSHAADADDADRLARPAARERRRRRRRRDRRALLARIRPRDHTRHSYVVGLEGRPHAYRGSPPAPCRVPRRERARALRRHRRGLCRADAPASVRFLPQYDNVFLSHADRSRIMDTVVWDGSFSHWGTLFVDGYLAGAWKLREQAGEAMLTVVLRSRVRSADRTEVRAEAKRLLAFLAPTARSRRLDLQGPAR